jgi:excinuclease ABC subunit C
MAASNARQSLKACKYRLISGGINPEKALEELQNLLSLPYLPNRIEGYDISNIQGQMATGSMVVFNNGKPSPSQYRRFKIKTVYQADDYSMLREVLKRRFRYKPESQAAAWVKPDLVLIDGGKGQLAAALDSIPTSIREITAIASLAKENEELFIPGNSKSVPVGINSAAMRLLQQIRDEAHRFAIGYHRTLRTKRGFQSKLDSVEGIGQKRKRALLNRFGSVARIRQANLEQLMEVEGISARIARRIKEVI